MSLLKRALLVLVVIASITTNFTIPSGAATPSVGPVAAATTIDEILAATDYRASDADLLRLYRAFFDREPDVAGAVYWIGKARAGFTLEQIAEFFTGVPEYKNLYDGTTNEQFLDVVYLHVLGRGYDQGGFVYWLDQMNRFGLSRGGVVRWVTASAEFKGNYPYAPIVVAVQPVLPPPVPTPPPTTYKNCTAVWNALGRPILSNDPGYELKFDADQDGIGCENDPR